MFWAVPFSSELVWDEKYSDGGEDHLLTLTLMLKEYYYSLLTMVTVKMRRWSQIPVAMIMQS